jgi:hypothetical protein
MEDPTSSADAASVTATVHITSNASLQDELNKIMRKNSTPIEDDLLIDSIEDDLSQPLDTTIQKDKRKIQLILDDLGFNNSPQKPVKSSVFLNMPNPVNDISAIAGKKLSDDEIIDFLQRLWRPKKFYEFPSDSRNTRFAWLAKHPFCTFSDVQRGLYCICCALRSVTRFPKNGSSVQLVTVPLKRFDDLTRKLRDHSSTIYHGENLEYINKLCPNWMNPSPVAIQNEAIEGDIASVDEEQMEGLYY